MKRGILIGTMWLMLFWASGCATVIERGTTYERRPVPLYPATAMDFDHIGASVGDGTTWLMDIHGWHRPLAFVIFTLDIPISLVTDTLFLPIDLGMYLTHDKNPPNQGIQPTQ